MGESSGWTLWIWSWDRRKDVAGQKYIQKWIPIVAAAHLSKASEEEKTFLMNWIDVVDYT